MNIVSLEMVKPGDLAVIQNWLDNNQSVTIKFVSMGDNFCYIFYE